MILQSPFISDSYWMVYLHNTNGTAHTFIYHGYLQSEIWERLAQLLTLPSLYKAVSGHVKWQECKSKKWEATMTPQGVTSRMLCQLFPSQLWADSYSEKAKPSLRHRHRKPSPLCCLLCLRTQPLWGATDADWHGHRQLEQPLGKGCSGTETFSLESISWQREESTFRPWR